MMNINVMVADDHIFAMEGLREVVEMAEDMTIVAAVHKLFQVKLKVEEHQPDVLVLDIAWPGDKHAGIKLIPQVNEVSPKTKIVTVTVYPEMLSPAQEKGAYPLKKDFSIDELHNTIRWAHQDRNGEMIIQIHGINVNLTPREKDVLLEITKGSSDNEIAAEFKIAPGTIKKHVSRILSKLDAKNRAEAAVIAVRSGILNQQ